MQTKLVIRPNSTSLKKNLIHIFQIYDSFVNNLNKFKCTIKRTFPNIFELTKKSKNKNKNQFKSSESEINYELDR